MHGALVGATLQLVVGRNPLGLHALLYPIARGAWLFVPLQIKAAPTLCEVLQWIKPAWGAFLSAAVKVGELKWVLEVPRTPSYGEGAMELAACPQVRVGVDSACFCGLLCCRLFLEACKGCSLGPAFVSNCHHP